MDRYSEEFKRELTRKHWENMAYERARSAKMKKQAEKQPEKK